MANRRLALVVQYDGTDYAGMQWQPNVLTVQSELEHALRSVLGHEARITAASRTDSGVHALGQVVSFQTDVPIPAGNLGRALNDRLPVAVNVLSCQEMDADFHPRYAARSKLYWYRILNREGGSPFIERYAWHVREPLDVELLEAGGAALVGRHDFSAFRAAGSSVKTSERTLYRADCNVDCGVIELQFEGDGFLYMMVRIIVGTLVELAAGRLELGDIVDILDSRDRSQAGPTAPPQGLCLVRIDY